MYIIVFGALGVLALRDRAKARQAIRVAIRSFLGILPMMLAIIGLIGLLVGLVPPEVISRYMGQGAGWGATITAALIGAVLYIPSLVAFPLAGSLLRAGASVSTIAAFLTALVMVGTVTLPLEIAQVGKKIAVSRNLLSLAFAFVIALFMGMVLR
jgi:uncharacterized membrane protein YraQ (UPF0718 family)